MVVLRVVWLFWIACRVLLFRRGGWVCYVLHTCYGCGGCVV